MATRIKHKFHSDKPDGADTTRARPSDWNDDHDFTLEDDTGGDVSTAKHGFAPKAPGDVGKFLRADAAWAAPVDVFQFATGRWYTAPGMGYGTSLVVTANRLYAHPFIIARTQTADRIGVLVDGTVANKKCRLGIYADSNGLPGALVLDAGEQTLASGGIYPVTINQVLTPGRYWLAVVCEAAATLHAFYHYYAFSPMGWKDENPSMGYAASVGVRIDASYGALPDPFGAATEVAGASFPMVFLRFSA